jgi:hypothetical protein
MANPTPRADALRAMREAKFEAAQRLIKEAGKAVAATADKPIAPKKAAAGPVEEPIAVVPAGDEPVAAASGTPARTEVMKPKARESKVAAAKPAKPESQPKAAKSAKTEAKSAARKSSGKKA